MKFSSIRFVNYRGVRDFEAAVNDASVLFGPNDTGKSSVLLGLDLLLGTYAPQLHGALSHSDFTDIANELILEARLCGFSDDERAAFPDDISVADAQEHLRVRLTAAIDEADPDVVRIERDFSDSGLNPRQGASPPPSKDVSESTFARRKRASR